jgi:beta-aspartyl-peptidase (threonine type)
MTDPAAGRWALAVHGGAKEIAPEEAQANRLGCLRALAAGRAVLRYGGGAVDAVEAAVRVLEDDPAFNAGYGSVVTETGEVEMCSGVMNGEDLSIGAVGIIKGVRNPVCVARKLLGEREILLAAEGARKFAADSGCELCDQDDLIAERSAALAECDTVGAVAMDMQGNLASATSTGGLSGTRAGRMGDSALPGCGYYADNEIGAVALSGDGEAIARLATTARVMRQLETSGPDAALEDALARLAALDGDGGGIAIAATGETGWWHNSPQFAVATASSEDPQGGVWLHKGQK